MVAMLYAPEISVVIPDAPRFLLDHNSGSSRRASPGTACLATDRPVRRKEQRLAKVQYDHRSTECLPCLTGTVRRSNPKGVTWRLSTVIVRCMTDDLDTRTFRHDGAASVPRLLRLTGSTVAAVYATRQPSASERHDRS